MGTMKLCRQWFSILIILIAGAWAENLYVRPDGGSYGAENGSDWSNAFDGFEDVVWGSGSGKLGAGDTLWVSGGSYNERLDIKGSGTSVAPLCIIKATASSHGTSAGWTAGYGSRTVIDSTTGGNNITASSAREWVIIDGNEPDAWCLRIPDKSNVYGIAHKSPVSHITYRNLDIAGPGGREPYDYNGYGTRGVYITDRASHHITFSHCKIHGNGTAIRLVGVENLTVEYCEIYDVLAVNRVVHENLIYLEGQCDSLIVRYSRFYNYTAEGIYYAGPDQKHVKGCKIYGNVFHNTQATGRVFEVDLKKPYPRDNPVYGSLTGLEFYNNTICNVWCLFVNSDQDVSGVAYNNILLNVKGNNWDGITHDYNWSSDDKASGETHGVSYGSNPFVDTSYAAADFGLLAQSSARNAGTALDAEFAYDPDGNTRGADGAWDMGTFEYVSTDIQLQIADGRMQIAPPRVPNPWVPQEGNRIIDMNGRHRERRNVRNGIYLVVPDNGNACHKAVILK